MACDGEMAARWWRKLSDIRSALESKSVTIDYYSRHRFVPRCPGLRPIVTHGGDPFPLEFSSLAAAMTFSFGTFFSCVVIVHKTKTSMHSQMDHLGLQFGPRLARDACRMEESAGDRAIVCVGTMERSRDLFPLVCGLVFIRF